MTALDGSSLSVYFNPNSLVHSDTAIKRPLVWQPLFFELFDVELLNG